MAIQQAIDLCPNRKLAATCSLACFLTAVYIGWSLIHYPILPVPYSQGSKPHDNVTATNEQLNVTKPNYIGDIKKLRDGKVFAVLRTEKYLHEDNPAFIPLPEIMNTLDYRFVIPGENICNSDNSTFLLLLILSTVHDFSFRNAIRSTWLTGAQQKTWPTGKVYHSVKHIFLIGNKPGDDHKDAYFQLERESKVFKDIVVADFYDSYRNLTTKVLMGFNWALQYCSDAKFILKVDSDTFINVPLMTQLIDYVVDEMQDSPFVLGMKHAAAKPAVVRKGKWAVSRDEYEPDNFPSYLYGHTYVVRDTAMSSLLDRARHMKLVAPEDAFITGILAKSVGIARLTAASFASPYPYRTDCELVRRHKVAFTSVKDILVMFKLWKSFNEYQCSPEKYFTYF